MIEQIFMLMKIPLNKIVFFILIIPLVSGCNKNDVELTFGEKYINTTSSLTLVDTLSVELSTIKFDSIVTSNTSSILVGHMNDPYFGELGCTSYFELASPDSYTINDRTLFDSIELILSFSSYFGDTTQLFKIAVHQLTESIEAESGEVDLYNTSSFGYNHHELGSKCFFPKPSSKDSLLYVRLSDEIGNYLFEGLKENNTDFTQTETFIDVFKGLAIVGNYYDNEAVLEFLAENALMRVYTHEYNSNEDNQTIDFPINMLDNQFNQIEHNFDGTALSGLMSQSDEVVSDNSEGLSFIQGGIALATKVRFPTVDELLLYEDLIAKAELVFKPKKKSYLSGDLPSDLVVYQTGKYNVIKTQLYVDEETPVYPYVVEDDLYQENSYYSFDITGYIRSGIDDHYFDPDDALLISFNSSDIQIDFRRVVIDTQLYTPVLKLYLLKY